MAEAAGAGGVRAALALAVIVALGPSLSACERAENTFIPTKADDPALIKAESDAKASADLFWMTWNERRPGDTQFLVKPGMRTRSGEQEYIWVELLSREGSRVTGRLANQPNGFDGELGDEVDFEVSQIVDWSFKRDGKLFGMYSTRVLMDRMPPEDAAQARAVLSPNPVPGTP
jgi:uncharacterized protein YegJ (DUF2314 family)